MEERETRKEGEKVKETLGAKNSCRKNERK